MIEIIVSLLLIFSSLVAYFMVLKPKRQFKWYQDHLEKLGYKTLVYPFQAFKSPLGSERTKLSIEEGDPLLRVKKQSYKYDIALANYYHKLYIELLSPQLIKEYFSPGNHLNFPKAKTFSSQLLKMLGNGLIFSEGESWKKKKKILNSVFNYEFIANLSPKMNQICDRCMDEIEKKYKTDNGYKLQLCQLTNMIFSKIMIECFFGDNSSNSTIEGKEVQQFMIEFINSFGELRKQPVTHLVGPFIIKYGLTKKHRKLYSQLKSLKQWGFSIIRRRVDQIMNNLEEIKTKKDKDIIEAFITSDKYSKNSNSKELYNEQELLEEYIMFFLAGTETTSTLVQVMIYNVMKNPEIETKIRAQIEQFLPENEILHDQLKKLKYLEQTQEQALRHSSPTITIIAREALNDCYVKDIPIRKGTIIAPFFTANRFSPEIFDRPQQFIPQRWQKSDEINPFAVVGFSAGPRTCIGRHLALLDSKICFIKIMKRYRRIIVPEKALKMKFGLGVSPENFFVQLMK